MLPRRSCPIRRCRPIWPPAHGIAPAMPIIASKSACADAGCVSIVPPATEEDFRPPRWLRNRHLQSILPSLPARRRWIMPRTATLRAASQEILLDCGDGVRLQCFHSDPARCGIARAARVAVLVHGWEGNAEALYILSLAQQLFDLGFDVVRLNLRDHGDTHHLNRELFHSCRLPEVLGAIRRLQGIFAGKPL